MDEMLLPILILHKLVLGLGSCGVRNGLRVLHVWWTEQTHKVF